MQKRLVVTPLEKGTYEARMTSASPKDTQVILNSILATYEQHLAEMSQANEKRRENLRRDFERQEKEFKEDNNRKRILIQEHEKDEVNKQAALASLVDLELWDPSLGFEPVAYSFAITQAASEGTAVNKFAQWLLMGAGLGAAVWLILWLLFKMLGYYAFIPLATAWLGCVGGAAMHYTATPVYESKASFQIFQQYIPTNQTRELESNIALANVALPHETRFTQLEFVEDVVENNRLELLKSFADLPPAEVPMHVSQNLSIVQDQIEPTIYHASFRSPNPTDSRTVLSNLTDGYRAMLGKEALDARGERLGEIRNQLKVNDEAGSVNPPELFSEYIQLQTYGRDGNWEDAQISSINRASFGNRIWPILTTQLLYGALVGYMLGLGLASIIRASISTQQPEKAE